MALINPYVIVVPVRDEYSVTLVSYSIQPVLVKFGPCSVVILNYGGQFKSTLIAMYQVLNLNAYI